MNLIDQLRTAQEERGWLSDEDLVELARRLGEPLYRLQGLRSFYPHFRDAPPRPWQVDVCRDLSCHMRADPQSASALRAEAADRDDVELRAVSCLGRCDDAPACAVNHVPLPLRRALPVLRGEEALPEDLPRRGDRRWRRDYADPKEHWSVLDRCLREGDPEKIIATLEASGLRGMGGAGFPTGRKWRLVRDQSATPKTVVCNADESEPGTFKDRALLEEAPHLMLEGLAIGAWAVGARKGWVFVRHEYARERRAVEAAIAEAYDRGRLGARIGGTDFSFDLEVFVSPGGYILGEETALLEALEGRRGEPRNKPPYPGESGYRGLPTLIQNVETLSMVPYALRTGRADLKVFSVSGDVVRPGVHEVEVGATLADLVDRCGGIVDDQPILAFLPGGASTRFLPGSAGDVVLDWEPLREAGSALGSGAVVVVGEGRELLDLARNLTAFFRNESCGKCVPCRLGTAEAVRRLDDGQGEDREGFEVLHETLAETSICGLGQAALNPLLSALELGDERGG